MSIESLFDLVENDPDFPVHYIYLAEKLWNLKRYDEAQKYLVKLESMSPGQGWIKRRADKLSRLENKNVFSGKYLLYPENEGKRQAEGGQRTRGVFKESTPTEPLVTIVTAVYENENSFQRCIDSVKNQTYRNIEYIVVDGGSSKPTLDVIEKNKDSIDYYISEPDSGIYNAMNKGISLARGDYICLLNSDDFYDSEFVEKTVSLAMSQDEAPDIVYTDYHVGDALLKAQEIGAGILFGHLHICHNTFLVHKNCYNKIGPYDENFRIVSDAIWMRRAFVEGSRFLCLNEPLFTLTVGGLSSGGSEAHRKLFISEMVDSYRMTFPQLSAEDAENIYLFRFNKGRTDQLCDIASRYAEHPEIQNALRGYATHCLRDRANFQLSPQEAGTTFRNYIKLSDLLGIDLSSIQIETKQGKLAEVLARIDTIIARRKPAVKKTVLHFISVFSAPPETFVYDLLKRLDAEEDYDNFVLFEHPQLRDERPFEKAICIHWPDFSQPVAEQLYKYVVKKLTPDVIVAHFALNEWKWAQRIEGLDLDIPTISMCHGIDAFAMRDNTQYRDYLVETFSRRRNTAFTAVSDYLRRELVANGIPEHKITLVHNSVNERFFSHRKSDDFYDRTRTLKLLCVGRLIQLKGHDHLIRALANFRDRCTADVHLTLVYGNGAERLAELEALAEGLGVRDNITFEPFVDFGVHPDFFAGFDCFIFPSVYSNDALRRSESFGVSVLEAITAGLPVITSDAGGLPEVIGEEGRFARIVPHADAGAIAEALEEFWREGHAFADNAAYAGDRLERFSARRQVALLGEVIEQVTAKPLDVAVFSTSTIQGAGYAAFRLHKGLRQTRVRSRMFTTVGNHAGEADVQVVQHPSGDARRWTALQLAPKPGLTIMTLNQTHIRSADLLRMVAPHDVINLHWHARFLSIENVASLTWSDKPVVMTIRDMMPLTGGCHCFHGCDRWQTDCAGCPQIDSHEKNFPAEVLAAKRAHFNFDNLTLVTLSNHTRRLVEQSPMLRDCRVETIPNSIELDVFRPYDRINHRKDLGLPLDRPIIGYVPSYSSEVKGYRELLAAFERLKANDPDLNPFVLLVGGETPATARIDFDKKALGYIHDHKKLAHAYSAADVIVVPSLEETFSNTAAEAIACGTPVVGFKTGAIPDLAVNGETGHTSEVGDVHGLAEGLSQVLRNRGMRGRCRARAEQMLSFMTQAHRYEALFEELVNDRRAAGGVPWEPRIFDAFSAPATTFSQIAGESLLRCKSQKG